MGTLKNGQALPSGELTIEVPKAGISIHVTPPQNEKDEDDFIARVGTRVRRKLSSPLAVPTRPPSKSLVASETSKVRRFSTMMVNSAAAAAVSRRLSATIGWCLAPTHVTPQIIRQGRALCIQYIRTQIKRSSVSCKKVIMQRLKTTLETEYDGDPTSLQNNGAFLALIALCGALERTRPELFRHVAKQATRAPQTVLKSEAALADLALAVGREICKENITWSKIAAVYCVCGALAREAGEASEAASPPREVGVELVTAPAAAVADLLQDEVGLWIATHGGWNGLVAHCRASERDRRTERNLRIITAVIVGACVCLSIIRLLFSCTYH